MSDIDDAINDILTRSTQVIGELEEYANTVNNIPVPDASIPTATFGSGSRLNLGIQSDAVISIITDRTTPHADNPNMVTFSGGSAGAGVISQRKARGSQANTEAVEDGDIAGGFYCWGHDGEDFQASSAIRFKVDGVVNTAASNEVPMKIVLETNDDTGTIQERFVVTPDGNIGIGNSSPLHSLTIEGQDIIGAPTSGTYGTLCLKSGEAAGSGGSLIFAAKQNENGFAAITSGLTNGTDNSIGEMLFYTREATADSSMTQRMRIKSDGNLIIGNTPTAPSSGAKLHIHKDIQSGSVAFGDETSQVISTNTLQAGTQGFIGSIFFGAQDVSSATQYAWKAAGIAGYMAGDLGTGGATADLLFYTANASQTPTERMRIDSTGNVAIGTTSSVFRLNVASASSTVGNFSSTTSDANIRLTNSGGLATIGSSGNAMKFTTSLTERMRIDAAGNVGIGTSNPSNKFVVAEGTGQHGVEIAPGTLSYIQAYDRATSDYGDLKIDAQTIRFGVDNGTERMRIDASGNVFIGRTSAANAATDHGIQTYSTGEVYQFGAATGNSDLHRWYNGSGTKVAYLQGDGDLVITGTYSPSDERLKENIVDAPAGNIDDLKVRSFDWKADGEHQKYGLIAQELNSVAPYAVNEGETEEDMLAVNYAALVPMLVKEIQDLKAEVAALKVV